MKQRILTAVIGIILIVPFILLGGWPFIILAYLLGSIALFELLRIFFKQNFLFYYVLGLLFLWGFMYPQETIDLIFITIDKFDLVLTYIAILFIVMVISKNKFSYDYVGFVLLATLYLGSAFQFVISTRTDTLFIFLFILFTIWATDSGAYFIGKSLGKRKLWPTISPNKTIGGAIGGLAAAVVIAIILSFVFPLNYSLMSLIGLAILISIFGQIGDLVASAIKRNYDVKDYGNIFPGHGGVLDRLDSFLFVLIILHVMHVL